MMIEATRTGLSMAMAKEGRHERTSIPRATGMSTIAKTLSVSTTSMPSWPPPGWKYAIERLTITGSVSTEVTELIAVSEMLRAMSPRNR